MTGFDGNLSISPHPSANVRPYSLGFHNFNHMRDTFAVSKLLVMFFPDLLPYLSSSLVGKDLRFYRKSSQHQEEKQNTD